MQAIGRGDEAWRGEVALLSPHAADGGVAKVVSNRESSLQLGSTRCPVGLPGRRLTGWRGGI